MDWGSTVVIQGKRYEYFGPLLPEHGNAPMHAQLYVNDPNSNGVHDDLKLRQGGLYVPAGTSNVQRERVFKLMEKLAVDVAASNPYAKDFSSAFESNTAHAAQTNIIINALARPTDTTTGQQAHARTYNPVEAFGSKVQSSAGSAYNKISVLVSEPSDDSPDTEYADIRVNMRGEFRSILSAEQCSIKPTVWHVAAAGLIKKMLFI